MNLDENISDFRVRNIDFLVQSEKFSPMRKAILTSNGEITKTINFEKNVMLLLRLGFDIELSTRKLSFDKTINEILKTSYSEITFNLVKIPIINWVQKKIIENHYKGIKLGSIKFD